MWQDMIRKLFTWWRWRQRPPQTRPEVHEESCSRKSAVVSTVKLVGSLVGTPANMQIYQSDFIADSLTWFRPSSLKGDLKSLGDIFHIVLRK